MTITPAMMRPNCIFVFGSNLGGKHLGGAARYAADNFGAEMGVGEGRTGQSYALPTMDAGFGVLSLGDIRDRIDDFKDYARDNPNLEFYVTRVGCGIAGYSDSQMAVLFVGSPSNCFFDPQWAGLPSWKEAE
jgi:hypothetical protein